MIWSVGIWVLMWHLLRAIRYMRQEERAHAASITAIGSWGILIGLRGISILLEEEQHFFWRKAVLHSFRGFYTKML
jgi:hypothetical protein